MNGEVLNSWKEIAAYMGRGVRTVQRWEQELGLPVRRPRGKERSAVIALKPDIDRWLQQTPQQTLRFEGRSVAEGQTWLNSNRKVLMERTLLLMQESARVKEKVANTLAITAKLRQQQAEWMRERSERAHRIATLALKARELTFEIYGGGRNLRNRQAPSEDSKQASAAN